MASRRSASKKPSDSKSQQPPPEETVYFVDWCLESRDVVDALRDGGFRIEPLSKHFPIDVADERWIPEVARRGWWVILTKDKAIRKHPLTRRVLRTCKAKAFVLVVRELTGAEMAEVLVRRIKKIGRLARNTRPPFLFQVTTSNVTRLDL
jgi:hypothetical protein